MNFIQRLVPPVAALLLFYSCSCPTRNFSTRSPRGVSAENEESTSILSVKPQIHPDEEKKNAGTGLFGITGPSMEPVFASGSFVLIRRVNEAPDSILPRGTTVVYRRPESDRRFFIKRIIGRPGETVRIRNGNVFVFNDRYPGGAVLDESAYLEECEYTSGELNVTLGENEYFVLGDNRDNSRDSRKRGPLPAELIHGVVLREAEGPQRTGKK